jgi:hypothetical protein
MLAKEQIGEARDALNQHAVASRNHFREAGVVPG